MNAPSDHFPTPSDATPAGVSESPVISDVRVEHLDECLGIGYPHPRVSWKITGGGGNEQEAYQVRVSTPSGDTHWTSAEQRSAQSVLVEWPAPGLTSRTQRLVTVRVLLAGAGEWSAWSAPLLVEAGLLSEDDWSAQLIGPAWEDDPEVDHPPTLFRRDFTATEGIATARLYVTAHGLYEVRINGSKVGDQLMAPGWSSYRHRLRYQTFDVTAMLQVGTNTVAAAVADGWFRGRFGFEGGLRNIYGDRTGVLVQLEVQYTDGTSQRWNSDEQWRAATGPITVSSIYDGESYDARLEPAGWDRPAFDDSEWATVRTAPAPTPALCAPTGPPVRAIEEKAPVAITTSPAGRTLVDFGQNLVGRVRIRLRADAGTTITLRHAEVLESGELGTRPLRLAAATDRYTARGEGIEEWQPAFTFHGFRYLEVDGWPGELTPDAVTAVVTHSDLKRTGWFDCSDPMLNQLHENVVWGMRGNFVDIPTDCPQRDERLGWTGDLQVFAPSASFLFDCTGLLSSWLADLSLEQAELGTVPLYVPYVTAAVPLFPLAAWGDAAVIVPWVLYQRTGDTQVLQDAYPSMIAWVDQVAGLAGPSHLWNRGTQLGDWLDPSAPPDRPAAARTDRYLVATAYHAHSARLLGQAARVLGHQDDADRFDALADAVKVAFQQEFVSANGRLVSDAPTAYALALCFDLLETDGQRQRAGQRLVGLVRADDHRIGTGFVGTPIICDALHIAGAYDTAYHLLLQRQCPSWLYPITMGATTIWERWDSMLPDGSINPGDMTSFNHYALGAVADWMHRTVAGLAPAGPGYRRLTVAPRPGGGLTHASAVHDTPYGRAGVRWERSDGRLTVEIQIPTGCSAHVELPDPGTPASDLGPGIHTVSCSYRDAVDDPPMPALPRFGQETD